MPIPRKATVTASTAISFTRNGLVTPASTLAPQQNELSLLPKKIGHFGIFRDESNSMRFYRKPSFYEEVIIGVRDRVGDKAANQVYVHLTVISEGYVHSDIVPLSKLVVPDFKPDGSTPLGGAFTSHVSREEDFIKLVLDQEVSIRHYETLIISDLKAEGESSEATNAGITAFINHQSKYRGKTTVIGPSAETMDWLVAARLGVSRENIQYLDKAKPETLLQFTLDSITQTSRKLG